MNDNPSKPMRAGLAAVKNMLATASKQEAGYFSEILARDERLDELAAMLRDVLVWYGDHSPERDELGARLRLALIASKQYHVSATTELRARASALLAKHEA